MKVVFLTSGPRGAGKSKYAQYVKDNHSNVDILSRDQLLINLFGTTSLSPYDGSHYYGFQKLKEKLKELLSNCDTSRLIFDCWNGSSTERKNILAMLREYGADKVVCWKFITPLDVCIDWFLTKPDVQGYTEDSCRNDYKLYHSTSINIEEDGFDSVQYINPLQLIIPGVPFI